MELDISSGIIYEHDDLYPYIHKIDDEFLLNLWMFQAFRYFYQILSDTRFPCLFGRHAFKQKTIEYGFVSEENHEENLIDLMFLYTEKNKNKSIKERLYHPMIIFFEKGKMNSLEAEQQFCWQQLQLLNEKDSKPWPEHLPKDPSHHEWSFCFNEIELFFNMSCPSYSKLRSRYLGEHIVFVVNPRKHFDCVAPQGTEKGAKVRGKIRNRSKEYNNGYLSNELGTYGDTNNKEWQQYLLAEPDHNVMIHCPLKIKV
ncbi:MAG: hypothetical protein CENE_03622 [Candidatus Celerinatantimonas neptuna]|nr:MAG: hypothetical protein CENE_03622 [Candidatus Celerinatantimonas neptuna]